MDAADARDALTAALHPEAPGLKAQLVVLQRVVEANQVTAGPRGQCTLLVCGWKGACVWLERCLFALATHT